jgi:hypothetical protein
VFCIRHWVFGRLAGETRETKTGGLSGCFFAMVFL